MKILQLAIMITLFGIFLGMNHAFAQENSCPAGYVMEQNKLQYHPGNVIPIKIYSPNLECKHLPATIQITVYNCTGNTRSNILYQESRQIINETWFNYTVPKWTDSNGRFTFVVSTTWPDRQLTGDFFLQFLSYDEEKIPKSFNITMWTEPSSFTNDGSGTTIFLKTCPFTPPTDYNRQEKRDPSTGLITEPGSDIIVEHHVTLPNGSKTIQQDYLGPMVDCNTVVSGSHINANVLGMWSDYDTIRWVWKNSTHELSTKSINFTVTPALYETKQLQEVDIKKIFSQLGPTQDLSQYIDLLDWSKDGKSILFDYQGMNLGIMSSDGNNATHLDVPEIFTHIDGARFLPSGDSIIILAGKSDASVSNLYKFSLNDKKLSQITNSSSGQVINSFAITPNGSIVYGSDTISSTGDYFGFYMWLVDSNGNKIAKLYEKSFDPSVRYSKDFDGRDHFYVQDVSNDGKKILVYSTNSTGWFQIHSSIGLFDMQNKKFDSRFATFGIKQRLTPAGDLVVYATPPGDKTPGGPIGIVSTDNSYHEILRSGESLPGDYPTSFVISPDGKFILSKIQPWSSSDQKIFKMELAQPVPEFPVSIVILLISFVSVIIFYRMKFKK